MIGGYPHCRKPPNQTSPECSPSRDLSHILLQEEQILQENLLFWGKLESFGIHMTITHIYMTLWGKKHDFFVESFFDLPQLQMLHLCCFTSPIWFARYHRYRDIYQVLPHMLQIQSLASIYTNVAMGAPTGTIRIRISICSSSFTVIFESQLPLPECQQEWSRHPWEII